MARMKRKEIAIKGLEGNEGCLFPYGDGHKKSRRLSFSGVFASAPTGDEI